MSHVGFAGTEIGSMGLSDLLRIRLCGRFGSRGSSDPMSVEMLVSKLRISGQILPRTWCRFVSSPLNVTLKVLPP